MYLVYKVLVWLYTSVNNFRSTVTHRYLYNVPTSRPENERELVIIPFGLLLLPLRTASELLLLLSCED